MRRCVSGCSDCVCRVAGIGVSVEKIEDGVW